MRVGTWNLQKAENSVGVEQLETLERHRLDAVVLTEPSEAALRHRWTIVTSAERSSGLPWVAIGGEGLVARGRPRMLSTAAETVVDGRRVLLYGSVLPWNAASHQLPEEARGRSSEQFFVEELDEQATEVADFCRDPDLTVVWAGDFNQSLLGPLHVGSRARREALQRRLAELRFEAWNRLAPHRVPGLFTIDLICGPADIAVVGSDTIPASVSGRILSDHPGYIVELLLGALREGATGTVAGRPRERQGGVTPA